MSSNDYFAPWQWGQWCDGKLPMEDSERELFFARIAKQIACETNWQSILWIGYGAEVVVRELQKAGRDADGFAFHGREQLQSEAWKQVDLTKPFSRRYECIVCFEVFQLMETETQAKQAIANICRHTKQVVFSSLPYANEKNETCLVRPFAFWAAAFAAQGFFRDVDYDASVFSPWAVRLVAYPQVDLGRVVANYERFVGLLEQENSKRRLLNIEMQKALAGKGAAGSYVLPRGHAVKGMIRPLTEKIFPVNSKRRTIIKRARDIIWGLVSKVH